MADIKELKSHPKEHCMDALRTALAVAETYEPIGVMVVMKNASEQLYVHYNEELRADGAIVMCELAKALNVEVLLHEDDD